MAATQAVKGIKIGRYVLLGELGKGEFSSVSKALTPEGRQVAIKRIALSKEKERVRDIYERALKMPAHEHLVGLQDFLFHHQDPTMYIIMDMCDTRSVDEHLTKADVSGEQKVSFMLDIAKGLHCLHFNGVIHGDVRPQNVLLIRNNDRLICKLTDYCINVVRVRSSKSNPRREVINYYQAPETEKDGVFSFAADIYSAALVFYVISAEPITERQGRKMLVPAANLGEQAVTVTALAREGIFGKVLGPRFSNVELLGQLIEAMLQMDPDKRPDVNKVVVVMTRVKDMLAQNQNAAASLVGRLLLLQLLGNMANQ